MMSTFHTSGIQITRLNTRIWAIAKKLHYDFEIKGLDGVHTLWDNLKIDDWNWWYDYAQELEELFKEYN